MNDKPPNRIRVLLADDHHLMREGVRYMLDSAPDIQLVASVGDGAAAVDAFRKTIPDVTLMDLRMPGGDGFSAITSIRRHSPSARIVVLSTYDGDALMKQARRAGASAYLLKSMLLENMIDVIRSVHAGLQFWPAELGTPDRTIKDDLTPRECDIIRLVACGSSNREIAQRLGIGEETVKTYMRNILPKLGANDRAHAVAICMRRGYLDLLDLP